MSVGTSDCRIAYEHAIADVVAFWYGSEEQFASCVRAFAFQVRRVKSLKIDEQNEELWLTNILWATLPLTGGSQSLDGTTLRTAIETFHMKRVQHLTPYTTVYIALPTAIGTPRTKRVRHFNYRTRPCVSRGPHPSRSTVKNIVTSTYQTQRSGSMRRVALERSRRGFSIKTVENRPGKFNFDTHAVCFPDRRGAVVFGRKEDRTRIMARWAYTFDTLYLPFPLFFSGIAPARLDMCALSFLCSINSST